MPASPDTLPKTDPTLGELLAALIARLFPGRRQNIRRGKRIVRAAVFLAALEAGRTAEAANRAAGDLFTARSDRAADRQALRRARAMARDPKGGKPVPVVAAAIELGFRH